MRDWLHPPVKGAQQISKAVTARTSANLGLVPRGKFHGKVRKHQRLAAAPADTSAQVECGPVLGQPKMGVGFCVALVNDGVGFQPKNPVEGNPVSRIEEVINAGRATAS